MNGLRAIWVTEEVMLNATDDLARRFREELDRASAVLIGTHRNPDGDAIGSALAISHILDRQGIENEVVCHNLPPPNLLFLPGVERVRQEPTGSKFDLGIVLDLDSFERLGTTEPFFRECPRLVLFDHHVPHEKPGDLRIVDETAPATAVVLMRTLLALDIPIDAKVATCLLTGIVTDTGSFRFRNTTAESMALSAKLLELGADINLVSEEVFHNKPVAAARLLGVLLERMQLEFDERLAWGALTLDDFESFNAQDEDTEGFVNELLAIRTVQVAALIRQPRPTRVRVSLRSRGPIDVAQVAREFGGGGHRNAAGCSFDDSIDTVLETLVPRLRQCLASFS